MTEVFAEFSEMESIIISGTCKIELRVAAFLSSLAKSMMAIT